MCEFYYDYVAECVHATINTKCVKGVIVVANGVEQCSALRVVGTILYMYTNNMK